MAKQTGKIYLVMYQEYGCNLVDTFFLTRAEAEHYLKQAWAQKEGEPARAWIDKRQPGDKIS